jgi:hypothetical protein
VDVDDADVDAALVDWRFLAVEADVDDEAMAKDARRSSSENMLAARGDGTMMEARERVCGRMAMVRRRQAGVRMTEVDCWAAGCRLQGVGAL